MPFDLQAHRGARCFRPENTLPAFEVALDLGVTSIETDVHLTRDGVPVLIHDAQLNPFQYRLHVLKAVLSPPGQPPRRRQLGLAPDPVLLPPISSLTLAQLRGYVADRICDRVRFPAQEASVTPVAERFAAKGLLQPYSIPSLSDAFSFVAAYAGDLGTSTGKTKEQRERARNVRFDLELKRVPFFPEAVGDQFDGQQPGRLEEQVAEAICEAGMLTRTSVRCFDHRSVKAAVSLKAGLSTAIIIAGTAPVSVVDLVRSAGAQTYCPQYEFLDEALVRQAHAAGIRVLPWTVNEPAHWQRLVDWGVDGITTDFPDELARLLRARGIAF
jgi:glycerophosphoryl diester phosphodiesterase